MTADTESQPSRQTHRRPPAAAILAVPLVVAVILTLFAWPASRMEPRELPIGVAGPPAAAQQLDQRLAQSDGAFEVHRYATEAGAREAIEQREIYGAFVATPSGPKVLTASAASASVAQLLNHAAVEAAGPGGRPAPVEDVVAAEPATAALPSSVLPMVIAGLLTGVAAATLASGALRRTGLLLAGSLFTGLAATAIVDSWLGVVGGDWAANAAALSLTVLAIAATIAGLKALWGRRGVIAGALTMVLIGNPFSAAATGPEMLPTPAGGIGQLLPPGAGANLLRSTGLFDGAAAGQHVLVLSAWAVAGLAALTLAALRDRDRRPARAPQVVRASAAQRPAA